MPEEFTRGKRPITVTLTTSTMVFLISTLTAAITGAVFVYKVDDKLTTLSAKIESVVVQSVDNGRQIQNLSVRISNQEIIDSLERVFQREQNEKGSRSTPKR